MARIRSMKPEFWKDRKLGKLTRDARLTFLGLIGNANDHGKFYADAESIRSDVFRFDVDVTLEMIDGWLAELGNAGLVQLYGDAQQRYGRIVNWTKHQRVDRPGRDEIPNPSRISPIFELSVTNKSNSREFDERSRELRVSHATDRDRDRDKERDPHLVGQLSDAPTPPAVGDRWCDQVARMMTTVLDGGWEHIADQLLIHHHRTSEPHDAYRRAAEAFVQKVRSGWTPLHGASPIGYYLATVKSHRETVTVKPGVATDTGAWTPERLEAYNAELDQWIQQQATEGPFG